MTRLVRPALSALLLLVLGLVLSACTAPDRQQAMVCVAVATAIGPDGRPIAIQSVSSLSGIDNAVRVLFRAADGPRQLFADCVFAGGAFSSRRTELVAVRGYDGTIVGWRLDMMKRWFLERPGAIAEAVQETDWEAPNLVLLDVHLPPAAGYALQQSMNALSLAALYTPLALAYALVYGLIRRINLALGGIAMIGAYGAVFGVLTAVIARLPGLVASLAFGIAAALSLAALAGWLMARSLTQPLARWSGRNFLVATVGVSLVISEGMRLAQGSRDIWLPPILDTPIVVAGGPFPVVVTAMRLVVLAAASLGIAILLVYMHRSRFGRAWRAAADDPVMARLVGIDAAALTGATFLLASGLAGVGGAILALSYGGTSYSAGLMLGLKALLASLVGGAGSLGGAVAGGVLIAAIETGWAAYFGWSERDIVVLGAAVVLFLLKPEGITGRRRAPEEGRGVRLS